jgi:predicted RNase H-related nuclease YkuK (DUF458 family)
MGWKDHNNKNVELADFLAEYGQEGRIPFIGTDSKTIGKKTRFTTVFVLYKQGKGGVYIDYTVKEDKPHNLYQKLLKETWYSITAALAIMEIDPSIQADFLEIHIDVNDNPKHKSGKYRGELMGMVLGQGFRCESKPKSWAATTLADKISRNPNKLYIGKGEK